MNNGFNGTGTAFVFYIILAICMPFVHIYRTLRHREQFKLRFVLHHFLTGLTITGIALVCIGIVWRNIEHTTHGQLHALLLATAWLAIGTIVVWITIPRMVRTTYRVRGKRSLLYLKNPLIHPWFAMPLYTQTPRNIGNRDHLRRRGRSVAEVMQPIVNDVTVVRGLKVRSSGSDRYRAIPSVTSGSPEDHTVQRANITRSRTVRRIMGASLAIRTPARDVIQR